MKFSERIGQKKAKDTIQIDNMDDDLRNGLWNAVQFFYLDKLKRQYFSETPHYVFYKILWHDFFKLPLDSIDDWIPTTIAQIRKWFFTWRWYEVYDFLEFISNHDIGTDGSKFRDFCNSIFERELSGYRFINEVIAPITNSTEIEEIDLAISNSTQLNIIGVKTHLESALVKLADRSSPDYRNSIKESISAVESISKVISNNSKDSLGSALDKIRGKINLHPSLEKGFKQIYGYTSDADGIRHALTEESTCDFEDAKYMLVSSSAFVNYLIAKANKAGIEI